MHGVLLAQGTQKLMCEQQQQCALCQRVEGEGVREWPAVVSVAKRLAKDSTRGAIRYYTQHTAIVPHSAHTQTHTQTRTLLENSSCTRSTLCTYQEPPSQQASLTFR